MTTPPYNEKQAVLRAFDELLNAFRVTGSLSVGSQPSVGASSKITIDAITPVEVKVGASRLTNRQFVAVQPLNGKIRFGYHTISPTDGFKVAKDQFHTWPIDSTIAVYIIAESGTVDVMIGEGA